MAGMKQIDIVGHAEVGSDSFDFKIGPWSGKVGLLVKRVSPEGSRETGAGLWDTIEKAKEIAETMVTLAFGPNANVEWSNFG
jgi:hypothetical protein